MILNDEVSSNSVVKRVTKHFTVLINVPKEKQKMKNHLKPSIWGGLLPVPSGRSQTHLRPTPNAKCNIGNVNPYYICVIIEICIYFKEYRGLSYYPFLFIIALI